MHFDLDVKMKKPFVCVFVIGLSFTITLKKIFFKKDFSFHPHQEHSWICPICV